MGKKHIERLIPVKKSIYNPKAGKSIDITYYIKPKQSKGQRNIGKKKEEIKDEKIKQFIKAVNESPYGKDIAKQLLCNI